MYEGEAMLTTKQARRQAIIKEAYVGIIGWGWIAASLACVYFLAAAILVGSSWWKFFACGAGAWLLYKIALYYQLEREGKIPAATPVEWSTPPDETYYLTLKDGSHKRVHIPDRAADFEDFDDYVQNYNGRTSGGGSIVRVVSVSLQKQRLATGRDGTVWPNSTPRFYVHFSDGVQSQLNLDPTEVESWAQQWRSFKMHGHEISIESICDDAGYVIWPERDGSQIF
jgi:hypothetical protein